MIPLLAQYAHKINKPLIEPLIHDDATKLFVSVLLMLISGFLLYKILRGYSEY
jgi:hypothetical protein